MGGTWVGGTVPAAGDNAIIATTGAGVVTVNSQVSITNLTVNAGSVLTLTGGSNFRIRATGTTSIAGTVNFGSTSSSSRFTGLVTVDATGIWNNSGNQAVTFRGGITNNGTFSGGTGTQTFDTNNQAIGGNSPINFGGNVSVSGNNRSITNNNTSVVTILGNLTGSNTTSSWTNAANSTLNYGGAAAPMATGVLTASAVPNWVNYVGTAQAVEGATYYNLGIAGSGIKTMGAFTYAVNGTTTIDSTLQITSATGSKTFTGDVIINNGGTWSETVTEAISFGGNLQNDGTLTANTGVHTFTGAAKTFSGTNPIVIPNVTVTGSYTNSGTLTVATALAGTGTLTNGNGATLNVGGTTTITNLTASAANNLVNYDGASQTVDLPTGATYYHLTLSGSGTKTMTGVTTIGGDLSISGAATMTGNAAFTVTGALNYSSTGATTLSAGNNISIGSYNQTAGTFSAGANTITVSGNWNETGTFNPGTGTVTFSGATAQTISGTSPVTFSTLNVTNTTSPYNITLSATDVTASTLTGTVNLTPSCPNYTLTSITPAQTLHSCTEVSSITRLDADPTSAATVRWQVTFRRSVTGVDATAFSVVPSIGLSGAYITTVTGSGATWTVTANTGIGSGTLRLDQTGPGSVVPTLNGTFNTGELYTISATPALAEYRMDDAYWIGTANEVVDSSGSGNNAQSFNSASTDGVSPAIAPPPGTCRYGVFDNGSTITQGYVQTPLPDLTTDFTVTAWIRTSNNAVTGQRILIDDQSAAATGYGISLGDGGTGIIRFYSRGITPVILDSAYAIASNTWYFVAAVADIANKKRTIYVFDAAGALLNSTTEAAWTAGTWGSDPGPVSIGGETNASGESPATFHFKGNLDEVRVYQKVLSQAALATIAKQTHACPAPLLDHISIEHANGQGLTCAPSTLTIKACIDPACTTLYTGGVTGSLTASGPPPTVNWVDGTAGFSIPVGSSSVDVGVQITTPGSVVFGTQAGTVSPAPGGTSPNCNFGTPACTFTASDTGLLFGGVANHVSETSQNITVSAVKKADNSLACVPAFKSVSKDVKFTCGYTTPATGTLPVRVGGFALNATNDAAAACDGTGQTLSLAFDASGVASTTVQYADAGSMALVAQHTGSGTSAGLVMNGSASFIAAPATFAFSAITPAPIKAGATFNAIVTAKNSVGNATPNFLNQTVTITSSNPQPGLGNASAINTSLTGFASGAATASLVWKEVGTIDLKASLADYMSSGLAVTGTQANVGRFQPAYFDTAVTPACATFSYAGSTTPAKAGQPFTVTATAKETGGGVTANYAGATYAYATTLSNAGVTTGLAGNTIAAASFSNGVGSADVTYEMAVPETAPVTLTMRATDSDPTAVSSSGHTEGAADMRSGRAKLGNAHGSELLALPIPFRTEYWSSNGWVANAADTCSGNGAQGGAVGVTLSASPATCVLDTGNPGRSAAGCAAAGPAGQRFREGGVTGFAGDFNLWLNKTGSGNTGAVTVTGNVPAWLQYNWGSGVANPVGIATFGVYKGNNEFIYLREAY